jgi:TfoX/Sxy family transcriptional regulator of competence genes
MSAPYERSRKAIRPKATEETKEYALSEIRAGKNLYHVAAEIDVDPRSIRQWAYDAKIVIQKQRTMPKRKKTSSKSGQIAPKPYATGYNWLKDSE